MARDDDVVILKHPEPIKVGSVIEHGTNKYRINSNFAELILNGSVPKPTKPTKPTVPKLHGWLSYVPDKFGEVTVYVSRSKYASKRDMRVYLIRRGKKHLIPFIETSMLTPLDYSLYRKNPAKWFDAHRNASK